MPVGNPVRGLTFISFGSGRVGLAISWGVSVMIALPECPNLYAAMSLNCALHIG